MHSKVQKKVSCSPSLINFSFVCCFFCCDIISKKKKETSNDAYIMPADQSKSKDDKDTYKKNMADKSGSFTMIQNPVNNLLFI